MMKTRDERISESYDFMYSMADYETDRTMVRERFLNEVHKRKDPLIDIAETLDKMVLSSKTDQAEFYDLAEDYDKYPKRAEEEHSSKDFMHRGQLEKLLDPKTPYIFEDESLIHKMDDAAYNRKKEIVDQIKFNDAQRDYSYEALTNEEKQEISLFHSLKQDPYFKHYIHNHIRQFAEEEDEVNFGLAEQRIDKADVYDHAKFDRLNLFDFRRNLPPKAREARIDSKMRAYGFGKRKSARALVQVQPGSGKINVNGKPLLQYFFIPM